MSLGQTPKQSDMWRSTVAYCEASLSPTSIYGFLHRECHRLFPDEAFADLFRCMGRRSVPPRIVAVVMVLQRLEGLSDRDAVERFRFDVRWKYAAGGLDMEYPGFVHTVLVDMRERLRRSADPDRVFRSVLEVAKAAGMVGRKRVLDSTPLYDAVATQDTVTMIRSAIRNLLRVAEGELEAELRKTLKRDDDYTGPGKPSCDWEDRAAREALVDALARDAYALLAHLDGCKCGELVREAAALLATVVGQDLEETEDGTFRIARRVAPDRVISTVDPEARHGHKTQARGFDGYKGHVAIDPDSEIITEAAVTPGNAGDGSVAKEILEEVLSPDLSNATEAAPSPDEKPVEVYGDSAYGTGEVLEHLQEAGAEAFVKVQPPGAANGVFTKDVFHIDLARDTVTCPAGQLVQIRRREDGSGLASFGQRCKQCPKAKSCTTSKQGRNVGVNPREDLLQKARAEQKRPGWRARYKSTRPKVERKLAHLMRRRHGGRRARMRGVDKIARDFKMLCAAENLRRLAARGLRHEPGAKLGWMI